MAKSEKMRNALAALLSKLDSGGEFPDEVLRIARHYRVSVEALTKAFDETSAA